MEFLIHIGNRAMTVISTSSKLAGSMLDCFTCSEIYTEYSETINKPVDGLGEKYHDM